MDILLTYLILSIANAVMIIGVYTACYYEWHPAVDVMSNEIPQDADENGILERSKMIGWKIRLWAESCFGEFWAKPICTCPPCMASVWGLPTFIVFTAVYYGVSNMMLVGVVPYVLMTSGFAKWINNITQ